MFVEVDAVHRTFLAHLLISGNTLESTKLAKLFTARTEVSRSAAVEPLESTKPNHLSPDKLLLPSIR